MAQTSVKKIQPKPSWRLEEVGPTKAAAYLEHNSDNRKIRQQHVRDLAEQMSKGLWVTNNQSIGFDWDGHLTDGQHRLLAIIESGQTINIGVTRNLDPKAKKVTDRDQIMRSAADVFYMRKVAAMPKCQTLQAAINVMHRFTLDGRYRNRKDKLYQDQFDTYFDHYPQLMRWVEWSHRVSPPAGLQKGSLAGLGVVFSQAEKKAGVDANVFMDQIASGIGLEEGSPIIKLRERLVRSAYDKEYRLTPHGGGWLIIKTWNAFAEGQEIKQLRIRSDENPAKVIGFDYTTLPFYENGGKK